MKFDATKKFPYVGPVRDVCWNSRSLWAPDTIDYALGLARAHDISVYSETRETAERLAFLKNSSQRTYRPLRVALSSSEAV